MSIEVQFHGIDYWGRPVFKTPDFEHYFGSVDQLYSGPDAVEKIKAELTGADLLYFGSTFDEHDPLGVVVENVVIVWRV